MRVRDDTFVSLGGDSLSYVEVSIALEALLGRLPHGWHLRSVDELQHLVPPQGAPVTERTSRLIRHVETGVLLRAVAIVLIVGTHMGVFWVRGGAHALLAVAGFNLARFRLAGETARRGASAWVSSIARIAIGTTRRLGSSRTWCGCFEERRLTSRSEEQRSRRRSRRCSERNLFIPTLPVYARRRR